MKKTILQKSPGIESGLFEATVKGDRVTVSYQIQPNPGPEPGYLLEVQRYSRQGFRPDSLTGEQDYLTHTFGECVAIARFEALTYLDELT